MDPKNQSLKRNSQNQRKYRKVSRWYLGLMSMMTLYFVGIYGSMIFGNGVVYGWFDSDAAVWLLGPLFILNMVMMGYFWVNSRDFEWKRPILIMESVMVLVMLLAYLRQMLTF